MKIDLGNYFIETDARQYKVKDKNLEIKQKDGTINFKTLGYFTTLKQAVKFISNKAVLDCDDINLILYKLNSIEKSLELLRIEGEEN